jgi:hypothetical protein
MIDPGIGRGARAEPIRIGVWDEHFGQRIAGSDDPGELGEAAGGADQRPVGTHGLNATQQDWRKPRACLTCPDTRSTICLRNLRRRRPPSSGRLPTRPATARAGGRGGPGLYNRLRNLYNRGRPGWLTP